jgi:hypothetical protein
MLACSNSEPQSGSDQVDTSGSAENVESLPVLNVEYPERGSFDTRGSGSVRGKVSSENLDIDSITVNGESFTVDASGRFEADMPWNQGIQILESHVESVNGERAIDGRAFHAGPVHEPASWIEKAVRMEIDAEIIDDDDAEPDDIAGLIELALSDGSLVEPLLNEPIDMGSVELTPTAFSFESPQLELAPDDGVIDAMIRLENIEIAADVQGLGAYSWLSTDGTASADSVDASIRLVVTSAGGNVRVESTNIVVWINGLASDIYGVPDLLESSIAGWIEGIIETAIEDAIAEAMATYVENVLEALAVGTTFDEDLGLDMRLAGLEVLPHGIRFELDAKIQAIDAEGSPPGAGSMRTVGEPPDWPEEHDQPLWAAVDDDLLNQLGFAFWQTGMVKEIELDPVLLGGLAGGPIAPPLGPVESVVMSLNLPPTIEPTTEDEWAAQIAIGEWLVEFEREDGESLIFSVSFRSNVQVSLAGESEILLDIDARPSKMELSVGVLQAPGELDPGDLAAMIRLMVPPLLGNASSFAPNVPIPVIPLGEFLDLPSTADRELAAENPTIQVQDDGWLLLKSGLTIR